MNVHPQSMVSRGAVLSVHEAELLATLTAIYLLTGSFAAVHAATSKAQKRLARRPELRRRIEAEGWVV